MKRCFYVLVFVFTYLLLSGVTKDENLVNAQDRPPESNDVVTINGTANWATQPTGPDFEGVQLIPFQAQNPSREAWQATQDQIHSFLASTTSIQNIQVSTSGTVPGATHPVNDFSEVMVSLDPTDPNHLLGASKFFYNPAAYLFYTGVFESYDGGISWSELQPAGVETYSLTSDPVTTFDELGNGYFTLLTRGPTGLDMLKKQPGLDWEPPVIVNRTTSTDKQWIAADQDPQSISPYAGNVYMSWTSFGGPVTGIVFSRSTNRNGSWSTPISLAGGDVQGSVPGVAPDGSVYVVYGRNIFYGPTAGTIEFVKSTNGGVSFGSEHIAASITAIPYTLPNSTFRSPASLPTFAVSPVNGNLYIAWADYRNWDADIYFASSSDGGTTWTSPVRLNDDPISNGIDQFQPQISVAPDGRVAVMWFDRRLPCPDFSWIPISHRGLQNFCIDTFFVRSYDHGQTWTVNGRASTQTWDWSLNLPLDGGGNGFIGDYQGIASNNDYDFPFWNATANLGDNQQNYQEVFVARVPVPYTELSSSSLQASPDLVFPGDMITYTINIVNSGIDSEPSVTLIDTVPVSTTFVADSLEFPYGDGGFDPATGIVTWTGLVEAGDSIPVKFNVLVSRDAHDGQEIVNSVEISDSMGYQYPLTDTSRVIIAPTILATFPTNGSADVPTNSWIFIAFSEVVLPSTFQYTVAPDPGNWSVVWNDGNTAVTLYPGEPFMYDQTYTVNINVQDADGLWLSSGLVPNPWSFSTQKSPIFHFLLPLITKVH